jgi:nitrate reductase delta subunit
MEKSQLISAYRLISELFLYPEDRDAARIEAGVAWLGEAPAELRRPLETFLASPAAMSAEEYVSTLELAPLVPIYLGAHLFEEPASCRGAGMSGRNAYMLELANIYRHFGVEMEGGEMADFVPVVVEFLGISLERGDNDQIGLRRYLVETQLMAGIVALLAALRKFDSPYAYLVEALHCALVDDIEHMSGGVKWCPPAKEREQLPAALRGLTADNRATPENGAEL